MTWKPKVEKRRYVTKIVFTGNFEQLFVFERTSAKCICQVQI